MKSVIAFLIAASIALVAHAADPTADALHATFVKDYITLSVGPKAVTFTVDDPAHGSAKTVDGMIFRSNGEIAIRIHNLNPLTDNWNVKAEMTPDVSFAALKAFLDDLTTLQGFLPKPPEVTQTGGSTTSTPPAGGAAPSPQCKALRELITAAHRALSASEITATGLKTIINGATGLAGVTTSAKTLTDKQTEINTNIAAARAALDKIRSEFGVLADPTKEPKQRCTPITSDILVDYIDVHGTAEQIILRKKALHKQLGELVTILDPFDNPKQWAGNQDNDYVILTDVKPTPAEGSSITATVETRSIALSTDGSIAITTDDKSLLTGKFNVFRNSFFVAERAAAMVYNNLKYPKYGTGKNAAGETIIVKNEDRKPIDSALMLNLVMRFGSPSVAHPFLQFGVSSAKDVPGFLAGLGLRFNTPVAFSFSVGGMITRYKDLDDKDRIGKPISGTAEIDEHLVYKTSPVALYGALQLKF